MVNNIIILANNDCNQLYNLINNTIFDYRIILAKTYEEINALILNNAIEYIYVPTDNIDVDEVKKINFISLDIKIVYYGNIIDNFDLYQTSHIYHIIEPYTKEDIKKVHRKVLFEKLQRQHGSLSIQLKKETLNIPYNEIIFMQSEGRYVNIYSKGIDHRIILKLDQIENMLNNEFYRTHQSYIVNINEVRKLTTKYCLVGENNEWIPIANGKFNDLKELIMNLYVTKK